MSMRVSCRIEIESTPEKIWPWLENPAQWRSWLASDGPHPRLTSIVPAGVNLWRSLAADGQTLEWEFTEIKPAERLCWRLNEAIGAPFRLQQEHTLTLTWKAETLTELDWRLNWRCVQERGWRGLVIDYLINQDLYEMMDISMFTLKLLVAEAESGGSEVQEAE